MSTGTEPIMEMVMHSLQPHEHMHRAHHGNAMHSVYAHQYSYEAHHGKCCAFNHAYETGPCPSWEMTCIHFIFMPARSSFTENAVHQCNAHGYKQIAQSSRGKCHAIHAGSLSRASSSMRSRVVSTMNSSPSSSGGKMSEATSGKFPIRKGWRRAALAVILFIGSGCRRARTKAMPSR
jgi:hypothetical protein